MPNIIDETTKVTNTLKVWAIINEYNGFPCPIVNRSFKGVSIPIQIIEY